jgi:hypothetical protein
MSVSLRASAIRPPSAGHGEYGNTNYATRHIAKKAALSKQNAAHFPMIKF